MYEPKACFFMRSRVNGCRTGPEKVTCNLKSPEDKTLLFDSRFESGNLARAVQTSETDYECWLRYDLYTTKNTQWFYFRVANTRPNVTYRFTIVNFMKPDSLYNYGMRPLMYSEKNAQGKKIGWIRCGAEIKYYKNNLKYQSGRGEKPFYSLTWTVQFPNSHDTVYFAHCFPYTYTDLQDYLLDCSNDPIKSKICKQRVLCNSADAKLLRDTFIFKIVPMLNPDGVIVGNYRCSLAGRDLNRNYKTVLKDAYPSVWHTKNMIRRLLQEREIIVYCDLHGHSRKQNVFIYGCENRYSPDKRLKERVFPSMLNKNAPDKFHFESCKFKVQKSKDGTGRIVMWNMGILNSYTMEATFCGSTMGKMKGYHFSMSDYESLGFHFCDTLLDYCDPDKTKVGNVMLELEERMKRDIMTRLQRHGITDINSADIDLSDEYDSSLESRIIEDIGHTPSYHYIRVFQDIDPIPGCLCLSQRKRDRVRSSKDDTKTKERPASDQCEKKNLSGHQSSHAKQDKTQSMRYMSNSANKRPKSYEVNGEKTEDQKGKRNEYLEALTNAYLRNGFMNQGETPTQPHFRYSGSGKLSNAMPFQWEGLCPHHEQKVAASMMAAQISDSVQNGVVGNTFVRVWKERIQRSKNFVPPPHGNVEEYVRSQINPQASISPISRTPTQRHILEVSASQQRQQELLQHRHCHGLCSRHARKIAYAERFEENKSGNAIRQHPCPFDECTNRLTPDDAKTGRHRTSVPSATFVNYDTPPSNTNMIEKARTDSKIELLSHCENTEPQTNDIQPEENGVNDEAKDESKEKPTGRKSRMELTLPQMDVIRKKSFQLFPNIFGMREREETHPLSVSHPDYLINPHNRTGKTRVQSAKGEKDVDNAVESIRELRQSLVSNATQQNLSPTTGGYIKRLMQETDRDIRELTDEIKHDIEVKKKMAEDQDDEDGEIEIPVEQQYVTDNSVPDQFNPNQNAQPNSVFDRNNYVQIDELPLTETLMGRGYPEQWKNFATQDSSTMTDFKKPHGRKKGIVSNYPMSDRTYERGPKVSGDTTPGNVNNNNFNRRIPDGTIVESYQISALDRTNTYKDIHNSNNSASSRHSKSGANYDLRPISDRNFQEQFHRKLKKGELRETNTIPPSPKDSNRSSCSQSVPPTVSDKYFEPSNRVRSAKGPQSKQLATVSAAEALPTKIQLMISQDHQEEKCFGGQFLPLSRTIRGPFYRGGTKKK
ncbi:AGBL2_3 [Mytilus edulis]|uniref:AGBL2_3 n=1 Tax=Mytilus edulis TaxID=6550 RepID=A0A8S3PT88_MYTED|nr:AGBL2_3 [Mytilus edulis]